MKVYLLPISLLAIGTLAIGCNKEPEPMVPIVQSAPASKEVVREVKDYSFAQKAEYTKSMSDQLAEIDRDLEQLGAKIEKSSDAVRAETKVKYQALRDQESMLKRKLEEAGDATETTWEAVKTSTKTAFDALKENFQQSRQWLSEKIAP